MGVGVRQQAPLVRVCNSMLVYRKVLEVLNVGLVTIRFPQVIEKVFHYFEPNKHFEVSRYLTEEITTAQYARLPKSTQRGFEAYTERRVGEQVPNIALDNQTNLSDFAQPVLLIFGQSECEACQTTNLELYAFVDLWKKRGVKIVYVALDTDKAYFDRYYEHAPWEVYCDFTGIFGANPSAFNINKTPSYFLIDKTLTLVAKPNDVRHANELIMEMKIN